LGDAVFESESRLSGIEKDLFHGTDLIEMIVPASVEFLGERCFYLCRSLSSVLFESGSKLSRIKSAAFRETGLIEMIIPASVDLLGEN
jgi:hypothetical protein